jgi:D-alanyl-D-alanine carboxypeptidase
MITHFESITPNQPNTVKIAAGKTGFTNESLYCLVTYAESSNGHGYICVTAKGESYKSCVQDYITIYNNYVKP